MTFSAILPAAVTRLSLVIPALVSGLWLAQPTPQPGDVEGVNVIETVSGTTRSASDWAADDGVKATSSPNEIRQARVEQLLETLDQISAVSRQMAPERAAALEPVIVDLAQRTLDLTEPSALAGPTAEEKLTRLEHTVDHLVRSMNQAVDPEISL